jgi:hypothetical protein
MRLPPFELLPPLPPPHTATISPVQIQSVDAWLLLWPDRESAARDIGPETGHTDEILAAWPSMTRSRFSQNSCGR